MKAKVKKLLYWKLTFCYTKVFCIKKKKWGIVMRKKKLGAFLLAAGMFFGAAGCNQELIPEAGTKIVPQEKNNEGQENKSGNTDHKNSEKGNNKSENENDNIDSENSEKKSNKSENETDSTVAEKEDFFHESFQAAKNYKEILEALKQTASTDQRILYNSMVFDLVQSEGAADGYSNALMQNDTAESMDYSVTNAQVDGIAESDIVKTDGKFIYVLSRCQDGSSQIYILGIENGVMENVSSFALLQDGFVRSSEEMYLSGNMLVIVQQGYEYREDSAEDRDFPQIRNSWRWYNSGKEKTKILIYNIADRTSPKLVAEHKQDGRQVSSREKDGYLYVISEKNNNDYCPVMDNFLLEEDGMSDVKPENNIESRESEENSTEKNSENIDKSLDIREEAIKNKDNKKAEETRDKVDNSPVRTDASSEDILLTIQEKENLPKINDDIVPAESIYYSRENTSNVYTIITSICLDKPDAIVDSISIMTGSSHCYVSESAIYFTQYLWRLKRESTETALVKIGYTDGKFELSAQGIVKGVLDDQFSMDEKDGYLRLVTTVDQYSQADKSNYWQEYFGRTNSLYVLDGNLQVVGMLEGLAKDESIYSARFIGDIAYFVTYRNTDPLFSVDLSDPTSPKLLGALKIPGFSDYLHPFGDHLLLGIGYDTGENGQGETKIKLTMFDITDPSNVVEKHSLILDDYESSEACYNHKSVLVDAAKNIIGFPAQGYGKINCAGVWNNTQTKTYFVYGYKEETGFYQRFEKKYNWKYTENLRQIIPLNTMDNKTDNNIDKQEDFVLEPWNTWYSMQLRGLYIGDYFYVINTLREAASYQIEQEAEPWKKIGSLELK